jgi:L-alanine-DL-glutamate epimerase-like enolase superfamily enzyme
MPHPVADGWTWLEPDCAVGGVQIENGRVTLPEAPGLGVDLDVAMAKKIAWQP